MTTTHENAKAEGSEKPDTTSDESATENEVTAKLAEMEKTFADEKESLQKEIANIKVTILYFR